MSKTNNPIELLVTLGINEKSSLTNIQNALDAIKNQLDLSISISAEENSFNSIKKNLSEILKDATKLSETFKGLGGDFANNLKQVKSELSKTQSEADNISKTLSNGLSSAKDVSDKINNLGKNNSFDTLGLADIFRKEVTQAKGLSAEFDRYMTREFGEYKIDFRVDKNGVERISSIITKTKNEIGEMEEIRFKPVFDKESGTLKDFEIASRRITDSLSKDLDINIEKALSKLNTFRNEGQVTAEQFSHYSNLIKSSLDNVSLTNVMSELNEEVSNDSGMQKMLSTVKSIEKEFSKLKDTNIATTQELNNFQSQIDNLDNGDLKSAEALFTRIKERVDEINKNISLEDGLYAQEKRLKKLESDLIRIQNLYGNSFTKDNIASFDSLTTQVQNQLTRLTNGEVLNKGKLREAKREVDILSESVRKLGAQATQSARSSIGMVEAFQIAMKRFPVWMAASTVFYGVTRGIRDITERVIELDSALISLQRVSDGEQFEFDKVIERSIDNVTQLSGKLNEYLELVNEFARTGKTINESLDLANTTQMLVNISDLNASEAFDSLTAASIAFNIAAEDSARIADKLNEIN